MAEPTADGVIDVLGLGIVTVDDLLYVDHYPSCEEKVRVRARIRQSGGVTGTALVAAARLGARCAYAGQLGDDPLSDFLRETFTREGIDLSGVDRRHRRVPIHSIIIVDESAGTRTILFEKDESAYEGEDWPPEDLLRSCRVLFLDHDFSERGVRAARVARGLGVPVVADFERDEAPRFGDLLELADHLIIKENFARRITGLEEPWRAVSSLWREGRTVVVTCGANGYWWMDREAACEPRLGAAYPVEVVDTTGCGDVFHGAYAACLARGMAVEERLRTAAASAAIKAMHRGGQSGAPDWDEVMGFRGRRDTESK